MQKEETSTMGLSVCPAAVVKAPVEVVWGFLAYPEKFNEWVDGRVEHIEPAGPAVGRRWPAFFKVEKVDPEKHQLCMHVNFPFGMQLQEHVSCTAIDATS